MFIAHLPSGYICACYVADRLPAEFRRSIFGGLLLGSVAPDFDMFYFYLIDLGRHHHHLYWTHLPVFWGACLGIGLLLALVVRKRVLAVSMAAFFAGAILHLILDTPFAGVAWLYPFSSHLFYLVTVPATRSWWVWSFVFHWSFLFEIAIVLWALGLFVYRKRSTTCRR